MNARYASLHTHSWFSLKDSLSNPDKLFEEAARLGIAALGVTDHGVMHGVVKCAMAAARTGVKFIAGQEAYLRESIQEKSRERFHLTLLAKNATGYRNLCLLSQIAFNQGFYYLPCIDLEVLAAHREGLICLSGCLSGILSRRILSHQDPTPDACRLREIFGEDFFIEVFDHLLTEERQVVPELIDLSRRLDIPVVATGDCHYLHREDFLAHATLRAIGMRTTPRAAAYPTEQFHLKGPEEMERVFRDIPEAIRNTVVIADRCNFVVDTETRHYPRFMPAEVTDPVRHFRELCLSGLRNRLGEQPGKRYVDRLRHEVAVIEALGYVDYFLIIEDLVSFCRQEDIAVGPGRGSAAGSLVAHVLGITDLDPIRYGLLFSRFLDPGRVSAPDVDIDFCRERRGEVIAYLTQRYGAERVARIASFSVIHAKSGIRDVGRVMGLSLAQTNDLCRRVPSAMEGFDPEFFRREENQPAFAAHFPHYREFLNVVARLQGVPRHRSSHPAGVVIGDVPLREIVPLCRDSEGSVIQFEMDDVEAVGLLKIDILGLDTLTVIRRCLDSLPRREGVPRREQEIPIEDDAVFQLLGEGRTVGVFQVESVLMRQILTRLRPESMEDVIATVALGRPGPLDAGMTEEFIERKRGRQQVPRIHPVMDEILRATYGVIVYQEQIVTLLKRLCGYSVTEADEVRRLIGKKKTELLPVEKKRFLGKASEHGGIEDETAGEIWRQIKTFGSYGFARSHAAAYAVLTCRTAWLKARFPNEYMASLLTSAMGDRAEFPRYVFECQQRLGIPVLPPDVNRSGEGCAVERREGVPVGIRLGLCAVDGVAGPTASVIIPQRPAGRYRALPEITELRNTKGRRLNQRSLSRLIESGAMDRIIPNRRSAIAALPGLLKARSPTGDLPDLPDYQPEERAALELSALGLYRTGI